MHHRYPRLLGQRAGQERNQPLHLGNIIGLRIAILPGPARHLPLEIIARPAEVAEPAALGSMMCSSAACRPAARTCCGAYQDRSRAARRSHRAGPSPSPSRRRSRRSLRDRRRSPAAPAPENPAGKAPTAGDTRGPPHAPTAATARTACGAARNRPTSRGCGRSGWTAPTGTWSASAARETLDIGLQPLAKRGFVNRAPLIDASCTPAERSPGGAPRPARPRAATCGSKHSCAPAPHPPTRRPRRRPGSRRR